MADFASALYLGMLHPSAALRGWDRLTLGKPAAAEDPPGARELGAAVAALCGCEAGTVLPSTLHLFWDLFGVLAREPVALLVDAASYPVARHGAQRAAALGTPVQVFAHGDARSARRLALAAARAGRRPLILADGYTPGRDAAPPLAGYAAIAAELDGYLVLDDTQPLGVFGHSPSSGAPYGQCGGGSLRRCGLAGPHLILGSSLAKGFGSPLAVLCASRELVARYEARSEVRVHTSPPSVAAIQAAQHALHVNATQGDCLRGRLWQAVSRFRARMARHGIAVRGGVFPVQALHLPANVDGAALHERLARQGVHAVLHQGSRGAAVSFILAATHTEREIDRAATTLAACLRPQGRVRKEQGREYGTAVRHPAV